MTNATRVFRALCPACEARAIAKAAEIEQFDGFVVGCEHNNVAATCVAAGGLILEWVQWPAADVEAFARGSVQQIAALKLRLDELTGTAAALTH